MSMPEATWVGCNAQPKGYIAVSHSLGRFLYLFFYCIGQTLLLAQMCAAPPCGQLKYLEDTVVTSEIAQ